MTPRVLLTPEVENALRNGAPVVALESTIIAHGLPYPSNLACARALEASVRKYAIPATIAVIHGQYHAGLTDSQLEDLARHPEKYAKLALRDLPCAAARKTSGATTVSATVHIASLAGIEVHATGGIGGVHRGQHLDVSQDLWALATKRVLVVSAGVKSVLHIPHTLEALEGLGVPVLVWRSQRFPAFYSPESGCAAPAVVQNERETAEIFRARENGGVLLAVPVPPAGVARSSRVQDAIQQALRECDERRIVGKRVTPFLLQRIAELSGGESVRANVALAKNNAHVAALVAAKLSTLKRASSRSRLQAQSDPVVSAIGAKGIVPASETKKNYFGVVVAGVAAVDIIGTASEAMVPGSSNRGRVSRSVGGVACNIARAVAVAGETRVTLVSVVGCDEQAKIIREHLRNSQVSDDGLVSLSSTRTPTYCAIHDVNGELRLALADMELKTVAAKKMITARVRECLEVARVLVLDANYPPDLLCSLARMAKQAGVAVWYEPTSVAKCRRIEGALDSVTIMSPNVDELEKISGVRDDEASCVQVLQKRGVNVVVVTRGAQGAALYDHDFPVVHVPAQLVQVRNTSGAGDSLAGTMIAYIARNGMNHTALCAALRAGVLAASETCRHESNGASTIPAKL